MWFRDLFRKKEEKIEETEMHEIILRRPPYAILDDIENSLRQTFIDTCGIKKDYANKESYQK